MKTPDRILQSAGEVFATNGFDGATMDEIAEKANVEKANIYYYYDGKEALYRALLEKLCKDLEQATLAIAAGLSLWDELCAFVDVLFQLLARYEHVVGLAIEEMVHPRAQKKGERSISALLARLEAAAKARFHGAMSKGELPKGDAGQLVVSIEGVLLAHFLLPKDRLTALTGGKYQKQSLADRKKIVLDQIALLLGRR